MEGGGPMEGNFFGYYISNRDFNNHRKNFRKKELKKTPTQLMNRCFRKKNLD